MARAERSPVDREPQKDEIITQCMFNSRPKSEPRHVCLAVEAFPFACLVYLSIDYTCKSVRIYPINIVCNISPQN